MTVAGVFALWLHSLHTYSYVAFMSSQTGFMCGFSQGSGTLRVFVRRPTADEWQVADGRWVMYGTIDFASDRYDATLWRVLRDRGAFEIDLVPFADDSPRFTRVGITMAHGLMIGLLAVFWLVIEGWWLVRRRRGRALPPA